MVLITDCTGCPIFYQVSFRGTFRVVPMSFETCPKLYLVVRWINFKIWDKKKVEVFCPILIRWIWDPYCEKILNMVMTKKNNFFSHLGLNFIWANQIWEKNNFGFECPILIRWISYRDCGKTISGSTILRWWGFITPKTI